MSTAPFIVFEHLEEHRMKWTYPELQNFIFHWNEGFSLKYICNLLNREWGEGALLVMSIAEERSRVMLPRPKGMQVQSPLRLYTNYTYELTRFYNEVKERGGVYTVFDYQEIKPKIDLVWNSSDLKKVKKDWRADRPILETSKKVRRKPLDIVLLVVDLVSRGYLETRESGWEGENDVIERSSRKAKQNQSGGAERRSA